jgi:5'-deoxynucleotidase YfbR-like HD superfamily hydrolase
MNEQEFADFYAQIYKLSCITRYSGVPRIKDESVAEHSFFVASLVVELHKKYDFDLGKALLIAITHDWAESYIGDITWSVKKQFEQIKSAAHQAEHHIMKYTFRDVYPSWLEYQELSTVEAKIVALADVIQVAQYAENEVKLGNTGHMIDVANSAYIRLEKLSEAVDEFKR